ncbi:MAG: hypothetical protein IIB00_01980 [candidate division Zixibacteria bacterium]|nr:hypothetical protein [candidate division Zixibacteria bacterium]
MSNSEEKNRYSGDSAREQDSAGHRNSVDETTEISSREHDTQFATSQLSDSKKEEIVPWPRWITRFKDVIGLVLIAGAVTVGWLTLQSIEKQVETAIKQTEAVWNSTRPVLTMKSIVPKKDINPWSKPVRTPDGIISDSSLFNSLSITIKNVGQTPAALDTVYYEIISNNKWKSDFNELSTVVAPGQHIVDRMPTVFGTEAVIYLRVHFRYYWEQRELTTQPLNFKREYALEFEDSGWSASLFSSNKFDSLMSSAQLISSGK